VKLTKTLALPIIGLLLLVGAGAVLATTVSPAPSSSDAIVPAAETPSPTPTPAPTNPASRPKATDTVLSDVLDDLVAKGTINESQKTAVLDAVQARRVQLQADRKAAADALRQQAQQIRDFLSDGQITQDELDQLPADSPLRQLTNLMDDGKITTDELRSIGGGILRELGGGRAGRFFGAHPFGGPGGGWAQPGASPSPSAGTSS
jgi:polyhydroxyalkanoate synthesis regulator phasin